MSDLPPFPVDGPTREGLAEIVTAHKDCTPTPVHDENTDTVRYSCGVRVDHVTTGPLATHQRHIAAAIAAENATRKLVRDLREAVKPLVSQPSPDASQTLKDSLDRRLSNVTARLSQIVEDSVTDALQAEAHVCLTTPLCDGWPFTADAAYRTIAAVAWPGERQENRDGWAVTMRGRPGLFDREAARATERLAAAIAHGRDALVQNADHLDTDTDTATATATAPEEA